MGSADFSLPTLRALIEAGHTLAGVFTQPPKPANRGQRPRMSVVEALARHYDLPIFTPATLRTADAQSAFASLALDAAVVAAYGLILPPPILAAPRFGCLNVHGSLLPRWRGAAPIQRAILAGDRETGITIMQMDAGLDTGPILLQSAVPIGEETTARDLHEQLATLGAQLMQQALDRLAAGTLSPRPQPAEGATYATKLNRDEGGLDFRLSAVVLARAVRALNPWPGTWFEASGERLKVMAAEVMPSRGEPGLVIDDRLTIACGEGALRPLMVQRSGRAVMPTEAFLRGFPLPRGTRLR
jgi:methionyl-tRNA formyltransferase